MNDTVTTQWHNFTPVSSHVVSNVELPGAGPLLSFGGPSPRLNIDYGANTIRIDFVQDDTQGNFKLTFGSLNAVSPTGCGTPVVGSIQVTTNRSDHSVWLAGGSTFSANEVKVPLGPTTGLGMWRRGDWILINLRYNCETTTPPPPPPPTGAYDPCCPPWNSTQLLSRLAYEGTTIGQPYTLKFQNTTPLNAQMNAYIAYLQTLGLGFTGISMNFSMFDHGMGTTPSATGTPVPTTNQTISWPGTPAPTFFNPGIMTVGKWYRVRTRLSLIGGPARWLPENCIETYVDVRIQAIAGGRSAPGGSSGPAQMEFRLPDGTTFERPAGMRDPGST